MHVHPGSDPLATPMTLRLFGGGPSENKLGKLAIVLLKKVRGSAFRRFPIFREKLSAI